MVTLAGSNRLYPAKLNTALAVDIEWTVSAFFCFAFVYSLLNAFLKRSRRTSLRYIAFTKVLGVHGELVLCAVGEFT